jgi:PAS domain S-box-containing protein
MITVLYVDDEPDLLDLCRIFLEEEGGFRVETVQSPREALPLLAKKPFDAIVCDYLMPEMDGISLLKQVRISHADIPFILFTGRGREEVVIEALNNGADFYLQKGGDIRAQFTELGSKLRQAVTRRQAEGSLRESEKMLHDIIDFLPDATFAIDRSGKVIAWNRAIEAMTGIPASEMIGKDQYEYAVPFYGSRRKILIDLIFEQEETIREHYAGITRETDALIAETNLPRPRGAMKILAGKASPLYSQTGEIIGAIESIRDITAQRQADDELRAAHEQLTASDEELRGQYEELVKAETDIRRKEEQFREITSTIPGVVYQFSASPGQRFGLSYVSGQATEILGLDNTAADFFEQFVAQVHPDDRGGFMESIREAVERSAQWQYEGRFFKPSGEMIWLRGMSNPARRGNELVFSGVILDISKRKSAEEALRAEEEKYRTLVDHSQDAVLIVQDGNLVFANRALFDMTQYREADIIGKPIGMIIAPEDREMVTTRNQERMSGRAVPEQYELSLLHADQKTRILIHANVGVARFQGQPCTIGTFHDISSERRREDALQKSEQKYRELAELLPQVVYEIDTEMRIMYANQHAFEAFGVTQEDFAKGINVLDYILPSQHAIVRENVRKIIRGEPYTSPEYTAIRKDGSTFPVLIYASPIFHEGKLAGFRGVIVDISAWKNATLAQKESEERYRSLAETAQDLIYIVDRNDTIVYVNSYGLKMLGRESGEVIGKPRSPLFPGEESVRQYQAFQKVFTTGKPIRIESSIPLPDKNSWWDTHLVPLRSADNTITAVLGISRDISRLKQAEVAVKRSNEKLNLLNRITRHDVANQLTILHGYVQLAQVKEPDAVIKDFLKKIETAADTVQHQIEFTRAYQDLGAQAPAWFRLDEIFGNSRPAGIVFTTRCSGIEIFADPMLEKVFFNLFDNAIRHGERVTTISVRCETAGDELVIVVEDDGIGIPLDEKQKIFGKGYGKNTGYGLFLVREILAITNIAIHETGKHRSGARFEITVPREGFRQSREAGPA